MTTAGELKKQTSFAACWVTQKELGARTAVAGTKASLHRTKFGSTMSIVLVMNKASQSVVTADGEVITATTEKTWE